MCWHYKTGSPTNQDQTGFSAVDIKKVADQNVAEMIIQLQKYVWACLQKQATNSHLVCNRTLVMHGIYRYDTFLGHFMWKTTCTESKQIPDRSICIIQKGNTRCLQRVFCKMRRLLPTAKQAYTSQARVCCVYILQLYSEKFSALSGFTQCLMTPTAFVPIQCTTKKEFPRQFHLWFRHVFTCLIFFHNLMTNLSQQLQCHCSKQVPPSL